MKVQDEARRQSIEQALKESSFDALVCALPAHVVLLTGYYPVTGKSIAVASRDGRIALLVPEDEEHLAQHSLADEVKTFQPASLKNLDPLDVVVLQALSPLLKSLRDEGAIVGFERGPFSETVPYSAFNAYCESIAFILKAALPQGKLVPGDDVLYRMASIKTPRELQLLREACQIAAHAFEQGAAHLRAGMSEQQAADAFRAPLFQGNLAHRAEGFVWCMSGPNSAEARRAYAHSTERKMQSGDFVLIHCNSHLEGYWTDVTRTFAMGQETERFQRISLATSEARGAALSLIAPGIRARDVDRAAREVLGGYGYGNNFPHSTGHGVGFGAISPRALPRLHPKSNDVLVEGMVFNLEPAVYLEGIAGFRNCDVVTVTERGCEVLTPFQHGRAELHIAA